MLYCAASDVVLAPLISSAALPWMVTALAEASVLMNEYSCPGTEAAAGRVTVKGAPLALQVYTVASRSATKPPVLLSRPTNSPPAPRRQREASRSRTLVSPLASRSISELTRAALSDWTWPTPLMNCLGIVRGYLPLPRRPSAHGV